MKAILLSIRPEHVVKILNKEKIMEIRRSIPQCELPCKVYIYCTHGKMLYDMKNENCWNGKRFALADLKSNNIVSSSVPFINGKVVAEFTLKQAEKIIYLTDKESTKKHGCWQCKLEDKWKIENGLSKSQYNPEDYSDYYIEGSDDNYLTFDSKLTGTQLHNYLKGKQGGAWLIRDLITYDKPKRLNEFEKYGSYETITDCYNKQNGLCNKGYGMKGNYVGCEKARIKRPPQSYMFVEEIGR